MALKVNKRTLVLLVVMIVLWVVAIVVLVNMNKPTLADMQSKTQRATDAPLKGPQALQESSSERAPESAQRQPNVTQTNTSSDVGSTLNLPSEKEILETTFVNFFSPFLVKLNYDQFGIDFKNVASYDNNNLIEDTTSPDFQYVGYIKQNSGTKVLKKVYLLINGEYLSGYENELIAGRYKPIGVFHSFLIYLDTQDGRVKRVGYLGN